MISVDDALTHLFKLVSPLASEEIPLRSGLGRYVNGPIQSRRMQPPFAASSMDGYAVKSTEVEQHAQFKVIGEAAAGHGYRRTVKPGHAVRIFTGAPVPNGADCVVIQEDVARSGDLITITADPITKNNIRPAGSDFSEQTVLQPSGPLQPNDLALLASMNHATVTVRRKPVVALIPTGDELVQPGEEPGPDQIIASNSFGLAALLEKNGADVRMLPIAKDTTASLITAFTMAKDADLVITIGGASVGDHDLVADVAETLGMERSFYKIAMRPGKPLMAGRLNGTPMVGLPGNPVSAMVCGTVFVLPMIKVMLGLAAHATSRERAPLAHDISGNGPREHYMRAIFRNGVLEVFDRQDSALLHVLSQANALAIRPPHDGPRMSGDVLEFIQI